MKPPRKTIEDLEDSNVWFSVTETAVAVVLMMLANIIGFAFLYAVASFVIDHISPLWLSIPVIFAAYVAGVVLLVGPVVKFMGQKVLSTFYHAWHVCWDGPR